MAEKIVFNSLLVPVDFSRASELACEQAFQLADGDKPVVILVHVIDPALVEFAAEHGFAGRREVVERMRQRAHQQLEELKRGTSREIEVDTLVCEGVPFLEILAKAEDFVVDAIVMGKVGARGPVEKLLFGSTTEKVLRAANRPVFVLPVDEDA